MFVDLEEKKSFICLSNILLPSADKNKMIDSEEEFTKVKEPLLLHIQHVY